MLITFFMMLILLWSTFIALMIMVLPIKILIHWIIIVEHSLETLPSPLALLLALDLICEETHMFGVGVVVVGGSIDSECFPLTLSLHGGVDDDISY